MKIKTEQKTEKSCSLTPLSKRLVNSQHQGMEVKTASASEDAFSKMHVNQQQTNFVQDERANDNAGWVSTKRFIGAIKIAGLCAGVLMLSSFTGSNYSRTIHDAIRQGDSEVLAHAMDKDPQKLASALNQYVVGQ